MKKIKEKMHFAGTMGETDGEQNRISSNNDTWSTNWFSNFESDKKYFMVI